MSDPKTRTYTPTENVEACIGCEGEQFEGYICHLCGATADGRGNMTREVPDPEAICAAATPGPWSSGWDDPEAVDDDEWPLIRAGKEAVIAGMWWDGPRAACVRENAAFIVHARTAYPATLRRIGELEKLVWGAVHNAGRTGDRRPRWAAVTDALGVGSTTATALCVAHGADPDEEVGRVPECGCCGAKEGTACDDDCDVEVGQ